MVKATALSLARTFPGLVVEVVGHVPGLLAESGPPAAIAKGGEA